MDDGLNMEGLGIWITPLAMLPGVALLVLSTGIRFGQLHQEVHRQEDNGLVPEHLLRRALWFRNALVSLYVGVALLALASLVGGLAHLWMKQALVPVIVLTATAVGCVAFAAFELIRESWLLLEVIRSHRPQPPYPTR